VHASFIIEVSTLHTLRARPAQACPAPFRLSLRDGAVERIAHVLDVVAAEARDRLASDLGSNPHAPRGLEIATPAHLAHCLAVLEKAPEVTRARLAMARVMLLHLLGLALLARLEELAGLVLALLPGSGIEFRPLARREAAGLAWSRSRAP